MVNAFRKRYVRGFISPGGCSHYIGVCINNELFGVLGFSNPDYGDYDILMKADTSISMWEKSVDLLLFVLRTKKVKEILEQRFNREINSCYTMAFSLHPKINRYRKHGIIINKKIIKTNKENSTEKKKKEAYNKVNYELNTGRLIKGVCEVCGSDKVQAHHKDYNKPLDINWLCAKHHNERDAIDETCYKILGYNLGYKFNMGEIRTLKEAKMRFEHSWK